jgi:iron complex outermembrane receptor protein
MGDFETPNYVMTNTGFAEHNFSFKAGLNRIDRGIDIYYSLFSNKLGILRSSHAHTAIDIINAIENEIPNVIEDFSYDINIPRQKISHNLLKLKAFKNFDFGKLVMRYDFQVNDRKEFDIRRGDRTKPALDLNLQTHSLAFDLESKFQNNSNLKAGISGRYQKNFPDPSTGVKRIIPDYKKYDFSIYSIYDISFDSNWLIEGGIRYDFSHINAYKYYRTSLWEARNYDELFPEIVIEDLGLNTLTNPKFDFNNFSSNLGTRFTTNKGENIYFNYSISSRKPNPSELFSEGLHHSSARIEIGDLSFNSEVGHNISLTYNFANEKSNLTVNSFANYVNDFIYIIPVDLMPTIAGVFPYWEYKQEDAKLFGFDVKYERQYFNNFFAGHQFSLIKGYERENGKPLVNMPPANLKNQISYNFPELNNLNISLESEYVFRQNEYPNNNFEVYVPTQENYQLLDTSTPPGAYHLLNFASSVGFKSENGGSYKINLRVENLFNNLYKDYLNRLRYFTHEMGRNIMLSLSYNY